MAIYSDGEKEEIKEYVERFVQVFSSDLRRYKNQFGSEWRRLGKEDKSAVIYYCNDGVIARIIPKWLGTWVKSSEYDATIQEVNNTTFEKRIRSDEYVHFNLLVKKSENEGKLNIQLKSKGTSASTRYELNLDVEGDETQIITLPQLYYVPDEIEKDRVYDLIMEEDWVSQGVRMVPYPWYYSFISKSKQVFDNFDDDPVVEAHGAADHILHFSGIKEDPILKIDNATTELKKAVESENEVNEEEIHKVIEKYPFIIFEETDYRKFLSKPRVEIKERTEDGEVTQETEPDFIYHLYDERSVIVEIEAASKQLLKKSEETGHRLSTAKSTSAMFQIQNYQRLFDRIDPKGVRSQLELPDKWDFDYLLIIGNKEQDYFDRRSWNNLRDKVGDRIKVMHWSYLMERLHRLRKARNYGFKTS